jgi:hypothetical protein
MNPSTGRLAIIGLVALAPVAAFAFASGDTFAAVAALNVLLIVGSFHLMLNGRTDPTSGAPQQARPE